MGSRTLTKGSICNRLPMVIFLGILLESHKLMLVILFNLMINAIVVISIAKCTEFWFFAFTIRTFTRQKIYMTLRETRVYKEV